MAGGGGGAAQGSPGFMGFVPFILMFVIFYFLLIRPQQKKAKEHRDMITNLKKGDKIITSGGIHGRVTGMDDNTLTVEISDKVRVKVVRANISAVVGPTPPAQTRQGRQGCGKEITPLRFDSIQTPINKGLDH